MIVDALISGLFKSPLLAPFPPGTKLVEVDDCLLRYDPRRDVYEAWLYTPFFDTDTCVFTNVGITMQEMKLADLTEHAFARLIAHKIKLLQMRHWFNLTYSRGGYA